MNRKWNFFCVVGVFLALTCSMMVSLPANAAKKIALSKSKVTLEVGSTKTVRIVNTTKKVSWKVKFGKKIISLQEREGRVKIRGKKSGVASIQAKVGKRMYNCRVTVIKKQAISATSGSTGAKQIVVTSGKHAVVYQLNDTAAAKALYDQLPMSLEVEDFSDNEKIFYPPQKLDTTGTPRASGGAGTLAYYAPWGNVVMFYGDFRSSGSLYQLGRVVSGGEFVSGMSGTIKVTRK